MSRTYAIGDIHGCCKTFKKLLLEKIEIRKSDKIYCIGDYIDRGRDSKGVIDLILDLRKNGYEIYTLRGNHEQMMMDSVIDRQRSNLWLMNGGIETLNSLGISSVDELQQPYRAFLAETEYFIATDQYVFVHAGLNFAMDDPFNDREAMLWTREEYFDPSKINNRIMIHGHSPIRFQQILSQFPSHKINIDGGCVYNKRPGYGYLVAISLPGLELIPVRNIEEE
jgi:Calcineurin-like phosphoesterase